MPKGHYDHRPRHDLTGLQFEDWLVLDRGPSKGAEGRDWLCRCVCGTERLVGGYSLRSGASKGCGCRREERRLASQTKHGMSHTPEYRTWQSIWQRCTNPTTTKWKLYGGRGIKVCDRWLSFEAFHADMGPKPSPRHSIERRDGNGDYTPENCYWATPTEQANNTNRNRYLTFEGRTMTVAQWAREKGMSYGALSNRVADGWSVQDALTIPVGRGAARIAHRRAVSGDTGSL